MMRMHGGRKRGGGVRTSVVILASTVLAGCGAQELYEPPTAPYEIVGQLPLPSEVEGVAVLDQTAYLAAGQAGLLVVDISDPSHPVLQSSINTEKYAESVKAASTTSGGTVTDIAFVVEGTQGITTYDVTDPANPISYGFGTTAVDGNGLFIETSNDPNAPYVVYLAESWKGLRIFESDPDIPGLLNYNGVFAGTQGYARAVAVQDGFAYVADDQMGLAVLDARIRALGEVEVVSSCDTDGYARGVAVGSDYAYIADYENGLVVAELRSEQAAKEDTVPVPYVVGHLALPGRCQAIEVRDGKAFLAAQDGGVHIVDVSSPALPVLLGTVLTPDATGIALAASGVVCISDRDEGLLLLSGGGAFSDNAAPAAVTDLSGEGVSTTEVLLRWTAPGNDGLTGTAATYDVRYALDSIATTADWESATEVDGEPVPARRGSDESFEVGGLTIATSYYFALETSDASGNRSPLSNVVAVSTASGPTLTKAGVTPGAAVDDSTFVFEVTYRNGDGLAPAEASVYIDDAAHTMSAVSEGDSIDYRGGVLFRYASKLAIGSHRYYFSFNDGVHAAVVTDTATGPYAGKIVFTMGSPEDEAGRDSTETEHTVVLTHTLWVSDHEVTQAEYDSILEGNPSRFEGDDLPVENVTWLDAVAYCNARSTAKGYTPAYTITGSAVTWDTTADGYRLPTEAEWEAYCRAGTETALPGGELTDEACGADPLLETLGWYCGNGGGTTHVVKQKAPNDWNLYDMHGNVREWCWDWFEEDLGTEPALDPSGPADGSWKVIRGGSFYYFARTCRSAARDHFWPNSGDDTVGFRVVRTLFD